jgi:hypothetical protein
MKNMICHALQDERLISKATSLARFLYGSLPVIRSSHLRMVMVLSLIIGYKKGMVSEKLINLFGKIMAMVFM